MSTKNLIGDVIRMLLKTKNQISNTDYCLIDQINWLTSTGKYDYYLKNYFKYLYLAGAIFCHKMLKGESWRENK